MISLKYPTQRTQLDDRQDAGRFAARELGKVDGQPIARVIKERIERATKHPAQAMNPYAVY